MEKVSFGDGLPGYIVGPKGAPGLLVVQEWWGVTEIVKEQAQLLSTKGYRCLIPDIYKGKIGVDAEEASHLMSNLDFMNAVEEMKSAIAFLKQEGSPKVGITGFCMGGALTFAAASKGADVACIAPFYGIPDAQYFDTTAIKVPVQAHFGAKDALAGFSDPAAAEANAKKMKTAGCEIDLIFYESAGHAFLNFGMQGGEEKLTSVGFPLPLKADVDLAWGNLHTFLAKHLQPAGVCTCME